MIVRALIATTAAVSTVLLSGCSGDAAKGACPTPTTAPPAETALLPAGLSFSSFATVTHVQKTQGHLTVRAVTAKPIDEVTVLIQDAVTAVGYRPAGMDNEGFEAEVFFTAGKYAAGQAWYAGPPAMASGTSTSSSSTRPLSLRRRRPRPAGERRPERRLSGGCPQASARWTPTVGGLA